MFEYPQYLKNYLNKKTKPPASDFINGSTYYSELDYQYVTYMMDVVRPCMAYGSATNDWGVNSGLSSATGKAIVDGATRLVVGDKVFFEGNDITRQFFSDIWQEDTKFLNFLSRAERFKFVGGSAICKINTDNRGRNYLTAFRIDRTLPSFDEMGNIVGCVFFVALLNNFKNNPDDLQYWLTEERKYNDNGDKVIVYKVFARSGTAQSPVLPSPYQNGVHYKTLPRAIKRNLAYMGIDALNTEIALPYKDGLGVWKLDTTPTNSCMPDVPFGDPLLFGAIDLLWSIDVVYAGSMIDTLNGEGKVLVPGEFLQQTLQRLKNLYPETKWDVTTAELNKYGAENFVYLQPTTYDKEKSGPTPIQFDIRADQYRAMWELYQKEAVVRSGFSPTSIFPHLTPDNSAKTATEVTAEENLTRASVRQAHLLDVPVFNRMLKEVAYQEGLSTNIELKLSDYIGNKLKFDENIRQNLAMGIIPREIAIQQVNNLSAKETQDYISKIDGDRQSQAFGGAMFDDKSYFGGE
ncbi:MAG: hypothetical protein HFK08_08435 [Clostridia bacterium]|jgi:hypothetical protein|nr:hypothetical protein [Clostridia bacterium]